MAYYDWKPYVSVAARRAHAAQAAAKLAKNGRRTSPVVIDGRKIARTFWGEAWCDNLERYSDYSNRLPRGRSYVRNGSVIDLQVTPGVVRAVVSGSELYEIQVKVAAVPTARWSAVCKDCAGAIDSVVELLQGRLSQHVMARICHEQTGLFPSPAEITFSCSCPDWASMCKHVAAVLYGIGARLDEKPDLLFALRKVDQQELIARAGAGLSHARPDQPAGKVLDEGDLSALFGIELAVLDEPLPAPGRKKRALPGNQRAQSAPAAPTPKTSAGRAPAKPVRRGPKMAAAARDAISKRMKEYWHARRTAKTPR